MTDATSLPRVALRFSDPSDETIRASIATLMETYVIPSEVTMAKKEFAEMMFCASKLALVPGVGITGDVANKREDESSVTVNLGRVNIVVSAGCV